MRSWRLEHDYKLMLRYTNINIESVDVATIADQEEVNMDVSRKIYDRVGSTPVVPVIVAQERHPDRLDRDVKRDATDADKLRNAARFAFRNFWGLMEIADVEFSECTGSLKSLDEDLKNMGEPTENVLIGGYNVILADQCVVWRQMIYKRQNYFCTKDKTDEADRKPAQQQGDNLLRNSPLI